MNSILSFYFFFNATATTEIYTLSLHDALPIFVPGPGLDVTLHAGDAGSGDQERPLVRRVFSLGLLRRDRKSTRLNSSHVKISYAVFCLKKKKKSQLQIQLI